MFSEEYELFYRSYLSPVEGGTHQNENDLGGDTWYGVSQNFLKSIGLKGPITKAQAKKILHDYFWQAGDCDTLPRIVAWCHCDALINHNPKDAIRVLQRALAVRSDGDFGPITRQAAQKAEGIEFWKRYRIYRAKLYRDVIVSHPKQTDHLAGWIERTHVLAERLVINGHFKKDIEKLPWLTRVPKEAKTGAVGLAGFAAVLTMLEPHFTTVAELVQSQESLKAIIAGLLAKYIAGKNFKDKNSATIS